jgi:DNA-binding response OmpR family regulator
MSHPVPPDQLGRRLTPVPDTLDSNATVAPALPEAGLFIDRSLRVASQDGRELELTYLQLELLAYLAENPFRVHTRSGLMAAIWGFTHVGDGRTVDVHVARLRAILGPSGRDRIQTVRRVGYRYIPRQDDHPVER